MPNSIVANRRNRGSPPTEPIIVLCTDEHVHIVRQEELTDLDALARWLAESGAVHCGRVGFLLPGANGEELRCVMMRGGIQWGWRYIAQHVVPLYERYRRLAKLPRIHAPTGYSPRSTAKAAHHIVAETRHLVTSGESGATYVVTVRPSGSPRVECTCQDGQWQARRRQDARCSHAAAVVGARRPVQPAA